MSAKETLLASLLQGSCNDAAKYVAVYELIGVDTCVRRTFHIGRHLVYVHDSAGMVADVLDMGVYFREVTGEDER